MFVCMVGIAAVQRYWVDQLLAWTLLVISGLLTILCLTNRRGMEMTASTAKEFSSGFEGISALLAAGKTLYWLTSTVLLFAGWIGICLSLIVIDPHWWPYFGTGRISIFLFSLIGLLASLVEFAVNSLRV